MDEDNFQEALLNEIRRILQPLESAALYEAERVRLFSALGWDIRALKGLDGNKLISAFGSIYGAVESLLTNPLVSLPDFVNALDEVGKAVQSLRDLTTAVGGNTPLPAEFKDIGRDLTEYLIANYLHDYHIITYYALVLLTLIQDSLDIQPKDLPNPIIDNGTFVRSPVAVPRLRLDHLGNLLSDPIGILKTEYLPNGLTTAKDADQAADKLFFRMAMLFQALGLDAVYGVHPDDIALYGIDWGTFGNSTISKMLTVLLHLDLFPIGLESTGSIKSDADLTVGSTFALSSADRGNLGLVARPFGILNLDLPLGTWQLKLNLNAAADGFAVGPGGFQVLLAGGSTSTSVQIILFKLPIQEGGPAFLIGSTSGTRLQVGQFAITGQASLNATEQDYGFLIEVDSAAIIISSGDGDGFIKKVLPPNGLRTDFDLAIGWSNKKGLYFRGSAGLEATLPVHASVLGVVTVDSVYLAILTKGTDISLALAATGGIKLGPISASIERMGLKAQLTFPQNGGNLGPANLDKFGFKLPKGVGLAIAAGPVTGGGYLFIDEDKGQYAGILQLSFKAISLTVIMLLNTKLPDGSEGFSLLGILTFKGPPIQLSFGFTLNGVGGLIGVNRTVIVDTLRAGIKNRILNSILFPEDPIRNAPQILSDLSAVFPVASGRYIFGPMVILGWGTPSILLIEVGLVLELPSPVRLIVLGRITLVLPDETVGLAVLHMDVLGIIDFDKGEASVDATLYDSRVAQFVITGDMAMRAGWGASPSFALAVGGLNPRFLPPPNFPSLNRVTIALASGDNPRLLLAAYLGTTSNTVQVGARLDVYAAADLGVIGKFSVQAYLGFDALFHFGPFEFIIDLSAGVALQRNGKNLFSVDLHLTLTGPQPFHAWGTASFDFLGKHEIPFDLRIGDDPPPEALPTADPLPDLVKATQEPGNWSAQLPSGGSMLVSLGQANLSSAVQPGSAVVLAHPLGDITFRQRVVPLNVDLAKYGNATLSGDRRFSISITVNGSVTDPAPQPVQEYFAPAQFFDLTDDEKLSQPSFDLLDAGLRFGTTGTTHGVAVETDFDYESRVIDIVDKVKTVLPSYQMAQEDALAVAGISAAGRSPLATFGAAKYRGPDLGIKVKPKRYGVASTEDLSGLDGEDANLSYTEALAHKREYSAHHPDEAAQIQVVADHEVANT